MGLLDRFYRNVTESGVSYELSKYKNFSESGIVQYHIKRLGEGLIELSQKNCPVKILECNDINIEQEVTYTEEGCVSMTIKCGHRVHQEFSLDALKAIPSDFLEATGELIQSNVLSEAANARMNAWSNTFSNTYNSFFQSNSTLNMVNPVNLYQNHVSSWFDSVSHWFTAESQQANELSENILSTDITDSSLESGLFDVISPANIYQDHVSGWVDTFSNWINPELPEEVAQQCDWSDWACHQEALSEQLNTCDQESWNTYSKCVLDVLCDYVQEYDIQEILDDIQQNYLPSSEEAAPYAIAGFIVGAGLVGLGVKEVIARRRRG